MRIALFATCIVDAMYPRTARATVRSWSGWGTRSCSRPARPAAGRCTSTAATSRKPLPVVANHVQAFDTGGLRRRRRAVGLLRRLGQAPAPDGGPRAAATRRWKPGPPPSAPKPTSSPSCWSMSSASPTPPRSWAPTSRTGSPTTPAATACGCSGSATGSLGPAALGGRHRTGRTARGGPVLRLRRHLLDEERGRLLGHARGQDRQHLRHRRRAVHRRRRLLPDAHRRRAVPAGQRRHHPALRRDPGQHRREPGRPSPATSASPPEGPHDEQHLPRACPSLPVFGIGQPVRARALPEGRAPRARQRPAAREPGPRHPHHPRQAAGRRVRAPRLGGAARRRPRHQGTP